MENKKSIMHNFGKDGANPFTPKYFIILIILIAAGIGSGFFLSKLNPGIIQNSSLPSPLEKSAVEKGKIYGSSDAGTFKDTAEGKLKEGGIEGEGQFHLERPGGESQNVYMTSSSVDLSLFINRKIKVWGETQKAQKAGWLMDVGKVEVLE